MSFGLFIRLFAYFEARDCHNVRIRPEIRGKICADHIGRLILKIRSDGSPPWNGRRLSVPDRRQIRILASHLYSYPRQRCSDFRETLIWTPFLRK